MCYDDNARPPVPEGATGAAHGEDLVLEAADGNRFAAYLATPSLSASAQVLILPDPLNARLVIGPIPKESLRAELPRSVPTTIDWLDRHGEVSTEVEVRLTCWINSIQSPARCYGSW